jgi:hypothetical protein
VEGISVPIYKNVDKTGCDSPYIMRMVNLRKMRWMERVARMGEMRNASNILVGIPEGK